MKDTREYQGKKYETSSIHDVNNGDFIQVERGLIEIVEKTMVRDTETGRLKSWTITGANGKKYGMFDVDLYLRPVKE